MNQILITKNFNRKSLFLKFQFLISIFITIFCILYFIYLTINIKNKEKKSQELLDSIRIEKLYTSLNAEEEISTIIIPSSPFIVGIIEISKLRISYPIFSETNDELLEISPCRFFGPMPNEYGNLCIAAHNYDNRAFFSQLDQLEINDVIQIQDLSGKTLSYFVYNKFEVENNDIDCINSCGNVKEITLITCNNKNGNRIIVKAIAK